MGTKRDLIGIAGVHWVVSELSLRGLVALPTVRNTVGADVVVLDPVTGDLASLQVKASANPKNGFWLASPPAWITPSHFYVFLRRRSDNHGFEAYFDTAEAVAASIEATAEATRQRGRTNIWHSWVLPSAGPARDRLAQAWVDWKRPQPT